MGQTPHCVRVISVIPFRLIPFCPTKSANVSFHLKKKILMTFVRSGLEGVEVLGVLPGQLGFAITVLKAKKN